MKFNAEVGGWESGGTVAGTSVWERDVRTLRIVDHGGTLTLTDTSWW